MPISPTRPLQLFDLIEFDGSTNVASVRKIQIQDGEQVAVLRYLRDDGELEFVPITMTVRAIMRICTLRDSASYKNTRRPAQVGRASRPKAERQEAKEKPTVFKPLQRWVALTSTGPHPQSTPPERAHLRHIPQKNGRQAPAAPRV